MMIEEIQLRNKLFSVLIYGFIIVKVNSKGKVTAKSSGKATITVKAVGNGTYKAATLKVKVTVYKKLSNVGGFLNLYKQKKYTEAINQAKKLPSKSKEQCIKYMSDAMKKAYRKKLDFYWNSYRSSGDPWIWGYVLTDINKDGIAELMIRYGTSEADVKSIFYTYKNNKAVNIGSIYLSHAGFNAYPDGNGLIAAKYHLGYETLEKITFSNGKIKITEIGHRDVGRGNYIKVPYDLDMHCSWDDNTKSYDIDYSDLY